MKELSKKESTQAGIEAGEFLIESGEDVTPRIIEITRQIAILEAEKKTLKDAAIDECLLYGTDGMELLGCKISVSNTGNRIQYDKDPVIASLKIAIKDREKDVKIATNSDGVYFDSDGVEVEKVPVKYGSEVLKIQF